MSSNVNALLSMYGIDKLAIRWEAIDEFFIVFFSLSKNNSPQVTATQYNVCTFQKATKLHGIPNNTMPDGKYACVVVFFFFLIPLFVCSHCFVFSIQ